MPAELEEELLELFFAAGLELELLPESPSVLRIAFAVAGSTDCRVLLKVWPALLQRAKKSFEGRPASFAIE